MLKKMLYAFLWICILSGTAYTAVPARDVPAAQGHRAQSAIILER